VSTPRLEIRLDLLHHNACHLVDTLGARGIGLTAVTKATLGSPEVARALLAAGVTGLGESRIENVERLRAAGITAPITLIRSPMVSQAHRVVAHADSSLNTEPVILAALSAAAVAQRRTHGVILMVEMGDLREGILAEDLPTILDSTLALDNIEVRGIGTNLACQNGVVPDEANMAALSALAHSLEERTGRPLRIVSGGNSANHHWAAGATDVGRINDLRLGEAILLGVEPLDRQPIVGLRTDAISIVAEIIEHKTKPSSPWGTTAQTAFGNRLSPADNGSSDQVIVALGRQDIDPDGLTPPPGITILGASSDHLVLTFDRSTRAPEVGEQLRFALDYSALLRAMTSPFVARSYLGTYTGHEATQAVPTTTEGSAPGSIDRGRG
jgi:predicted amino acid racemase